MLDIQLILAFVFFIAIGLFLIIKRKNVGFEWMLFPVIYLAMYRSSWGIKSMDWLGSRLRPLLKICGVIAVIIGFIGMGLISYQLGKNLADLALKPAAKSSVGIVQPFADGVPGTIFVPFAYFIISIFIIAVTHEFAHGVMSRVHNCKVNSSGFAFLGVLLPVIPAAFVEPSEEDMGKKSAMAQLSILAAGAVTNIVFALLLAVFLVGALDPALSTMVHPLGVEVVSVAKDSPAASAGLIPGELITAFDGAQVNNSKDLLAKIKDKKPGDTASFTTNMTTRAALIAEKPGNPGKPYIGFQVSNKFEFSKETKSKFGEFLPQSLLWIAGLLFWMFNLSLGIGLFNLCPLGPVDGGKMFKIALAQYFDSEPARKIWKVVSITFLVAIILNVAVAFLR